MNLCIQWEGLARGAIIVIFKGHDMIVIPWPQARILDPATMERSISQFLDLWPLILVITVCHWRLHASEAQPSECR